MNSTITTTGAELSDSDLEAISGGCYRHRDDDYDCHKRDYCDDDYKKDYCDDDYDYGCKEEDDYGCHDRPRYCRPRNHCW